jgi:hypothetical protein
LPTGAAPYEGVGIGQMFALNEINRLLASVRAWQASLWLTDGAAEQ